MEGAGFSWAWFPNWMPPSTEGLQVQKPRGGGLRCSLRRRRWACRWGMKRGPGLLQSSPGGQREGCAGGAHSPALKWPRCSLPSLRSQSSGFRRRRRRSYQPPAGRRGRGAASPGLLPSPSWAPVGSSLQRGSPEGTPTLWIKHPTLKLTRCVTSASLCFLSGASLIKWAPSPCPGALQGRALTGLVSAA